VRDGGFGYGEEGRLFDVTGVPDERIAVRVDTRPVADRKWAAILRHQTQLEEHERIPAPLRWIVLDAECFVQAFPPREGRLRIEAVADTVLRVRYAPGPESATTAGRWPPRRSGSAPATP
jgi:hypothetical protein